MPGRKLLAAVDLGSNSFRLLIGRVETSDVGEQIRPLDSLKESVRLAAGLSAAGQLDTLAQQRGLEALNRFSERLRSFSPDAVRAVATNTLRVARNARSFIGTAEAALGFPIEVISGHEEARLIYAGAAHALPLDGVKRLIVDIGGGSTECIVGVDYVTRLLESIPAGCVSMTQRFFPDGEIDRERFGQAVIAARAAFAPIATAYRSYGWRYAVGTSGTSKSLWSIAQANFGADALRREHLDLMAGHLIRAGSAERVRLEGIKPERRPVLPGGLAIMTAVFEELGIESMRYCGGALRQGVLYDLLGRSSGSDMRRITVAQMMRRHAVDERHAERMSDTALALFDQAARGAAEELDARRQMLGWAAQLAECGMSLSHEDFHKHSHYILQHSDMPGFSQPEQAELALLALGQTGGLRKLRGLVADDLQWLQVLALRVASILHRRREDAQIPLPALFFKRSRVRLEMPAVWAAAHPLTHETLQAEVSAWAEMDVFEEIVYQTL